MNNSIGRANPYAPPSAVVADIATVDERTEPPFFAVSIPKLLVMSVCTLSLYEVYWFYRNWQKLRERYALDVFPFTRAIFAPFFCYQCFAWIRDDRASSAVTARLAAGPLAIAWIVSSFLFVLPEPYDLVSYVSPAFLVPVQTYVNHVNALAVPSHDRNGHFTVWNWIGVAIGIPLLGLMAASYL